MDYGVLILLLAHVIVNRNWIGSVNRFNKIYSNNIYIKKYMTDINEKNLITDIWIIYILFLRESAEIFYIINELCTA